MSGAAELYFSTDQLTVGYNGKPLILSLIHI